MKGVNLIPQPLRAARSRKRRTRRWMLGCSAYAAALLMSCAVVRALSYADNRMLHADIESTGRRIEDANRSIGNLRVQLAEMQERSKTSTAIADQPDWSVLLGTVAVTMEDEMVLREVRLGSTTSNANRTSEILWTPKRYQLSIRGIGRSSAIVSKFVTKLEQLEFFDTVKLLRTNRETFMNGPAVGFELECSFGQQRRAK